MRLKSLTLRGFKSFAEATTLKLEGGITCVVGPNGSGKSNIADAILWVLGEQRPRSLRGSSMEDVIFAGSASQNSLGAAEVTLVLERSRALACEEPRDIAITRRLFRSGESEYRINDSPARLIDIQELLSDSGLGRETYSIISQGRLEEALNSHPQERRQLIEEAAGILKHKRRKERAFRRLKSMEEHLLRAKDVLREVNRQLAPLRRQAEVSRRYVSLTEELRKLEVEVAVAELREYQSSWQDVVETEKIAEDEYRRASSEADRVKQESAVKERLIEELESARNLESSTEKKLSSLIARLDACRVLAEEKGLSHRRALKGSKSDLSELRAEHEAIVKAVAECGEELEAAETCLAESEGEIDRLSNAEAMGRPDADPAGLRRELVAGRKKLEEVASAADAQRLSVSRLREQERLTWERAKAIEDKIAGGALESRRVLAEFEDAKTDLKHWTAELLAAKTEMARADSDLGKLRDEEREISAQIALEQATLRALTGTPVGDMPLSVILGADGSAYKTAPRLADVITVADGYEAAIDAALSGWVGAYVAGNLARAAEMVAEAEAKDVNAEVIAQDLAESHVSDLPTGGLPPAINFVSCQGKYARVVEALLSNICVARDMKEALEAVGGMAPEQVIVTMDGASVTARGVVRSRPSSQVEEGVLQRSRRRLLAEKACQELGRKVDRVRAGISRLSQERSNLQSKLARIEEKERDASSRSSVLAGQADKLALSQRELEAEKEAIRTELVAISRDLDEGSRLLVEREACLAQERTAVEEMERRVEQLSKEAEQARKRGQEAAEALTTARERAASLRERCLSLKRRLRELEEEKGRLEDQLPRLGKRHANREILIQELASFADSCQALCAVGRASADALGLKGMKIGEDITSLRQESREARERIERASAKAARFQEKANRARVQRTRLEMQVNGLVARLVDELDVPVEKALASVDGEVDLESSRRRLTEIKSRLAAVGPHNPLACQQVEELEERARFIEGQIRDLSEAKLALRKLIASLEFRMQERFDLCFLRLNENFQKVFCTFFPGGDARLVLTDIDGEEPGVDIEAQPGGKRVQSLALLSGGERALVGLALLFAICYTRPSPFYVLDEVDAPLDDINTGRLVRLIDELAKETQIIMITHQRRTMETADSIYGVSMRESGISAVVSQKLEKDGRDNGSRESARLAGAPAVGAGQVSQ